jgi:hypothetical protein
MQLAMGHPGGGGGALLLRTFNAIDFLPRLPNGDWNMNLPQDISYTKVTTSW